MSQRPDVKKIVKRPVSDPEAGHFVPAFEAGTLIRAAYYDQAGD